MLRCSDVLSTVPLSTGACIFTFIRVHEAITLQRTSTNIQRFVAQSLVARRRVTLPLVGASVSMAFHERLLEFIVDKCVNLQRIQHNVDTTGSGYNPKPLCHGTGAACDSFKDDIHFCIADSSSPLLDYLSLDLLDDARCARHLRLLSIYPSREVPIEKIHSIRDNFTSLQCLHIHTVTLANRSLQHISSEMSHLNSIELEFDHYAANPPLNSDQCVSLANAITGISNLRFLSLRFGSESEDGSTDLVIKVLCGVPRGTTVYLTPVIKSLVSARGMLTNNQKILNAVKRSRPDVTSTADFCTTPMKLQHSGWPPRFTFQLCLRDGHLSFM